MIGTKTPTLNTKKINFNTTGQSYGTRMFLKYYNKHNKIKNIKSNHVGKVNFIRRIGLLNVDSCRAFTDKLLSCILLNWAFTFCLDRTFIWRWWRGQLLHWMTALVMSRTFYRWHHICVCWYSWWWGTGPHDRQFLNHVNTTETWLNGEKIKIYSDFRTLLFLCWLKKQYFKSWLPI